MPLKAVHVRAKLLDLAAEVSDQPVLLRAVYVRAKLLDLAAEVSDQPVLLRACSCQGQAAGLGC